MSVRVVDKLDGDLERTGQALREGERLYSRGSPRVYGHVRIVHVRGSSQVRSTRDRDDEGGQAGLFLTSPRSALLSDALLRDLAGLQSFLIGTGMRTTEAKHQRSEAKLSVYSFSDRCSHYFLPMLLVVIG